MGFRMRDVATIARWKPPVPILPSLVLYCGVPATAAAGAATACMCWQGVRVQRPITSSQDVECERPEAEGAGVVAVVLSVMLGRESARGWICEGAEWSGSSAR